MEVVLGNKISKKGFTLIELLVVITIIGVLASLALLNVKTQLAKARDAQRKSDLREIKTSLNIYYNIWEKYPENDSLQRIVGCGGTPPSFCAWGEEWRREGQIIMKKLPADPLSTQSYSYVKTGDGFYLKALLEISDDKSILESQKRCGVGSGNEYVVCQE